MSYYQEDEDSLSLALMEKRLFRISYEYSVPDATPLVFKFSAPCNFVLHDQTVAIDANDMKYEAVVGGTPSGSFTSPVTIWAVNRMTDTPNLNPLVSINTGGAVTGGQIAEVLRIHTASGTGAQSSIVSSVAYQRMLPPGDYYLRMTASGGTATGTLALLWEERP